MTFKGHKAQTDNIVQMLTYKRPHKDAVTDEFCATYIAPTGAKRDEAGNWILRIGDEPVLWSCHTDTVHMTGGRQNVAIDDGVATVADPKTSNCLGADDTAGVWLLLQMIQRKKEGLYIFHAGEERGAIGSRHIANKTPELLKGIEAAIAFDRREYHSVITHQGDRCCSDNFGKCIAGMLGNEFSIDPTGVFTDTKVYTKLIGECTNISVGYLSEHSTHEMQDVDWLIYLSELVMKLEWRDMVIERKPGEIDPDDRWGFYGLTGYDPNLDWATGSRAWGSYINKYSKYSLPKPSVIQKNQSLEDMVMEFPEAAAALLEAYGITPKDFEDYIG